MMQRSVGTTDLLELKHLCFELMKIAVSMGRGQRKIMRTCHAQDSLIRRFLIADALWSICSVVGPAMAMPTWWSTVMGKLFCSPEIVFTSSLPKNTRNPFIRRLRGALQMYLRGERPLARDVVELKQEIFCGASAKSVFGHPDFDKWRDDNADFCGI